MACPQCQSNEISPEGSCLICGYKIDAKPTEPKEEADPQPEAGPSGAIEVNYAEGEPAAGKSEVPPWRQQLSQRLHEIKQKRESMAASAPVERKPAPAPAPPMKSLESMNSLQERLKRVPVRKPQVPVIPLPRQRKLEPLPEPAPRPAPQPSSKPADVQEIRNLIDSAVSKQAPTAPARPELVSVIASGPAPASAPALEPSEGKLIFLSRTLAGLVDLIVVVLCTGGFIIAADYFSGIIELDHLSLALFAVVFLMVFFVYSLFFLSATNQTIGMMITDLRVVAGSETRPSIRQLLGRCSAFLLSLLCAGIGLFLGLFDRDSLCFHDRVSGTHVVRI